MKERTFYYSTPETGDGPWQFESMWDRDDLRFVAESAAEDYYDNHDGWEASWPKVFAIHESADGPVVALFEVHRDFSPTFSAFMVKDGVK